MGNTTNAEAEARRNQQSLPKGAKLKKHTLIGDIINNAKQTAYLPTDLRGNEVVFIAKICTDTDFSGEALVIVRPRNQTLTQHDWNWDHPSLTDDWEIVGGKLIAYKHCQKILQCSCLFKLLKRHFKNNALRGHGWDLQFNNNGDVTGLLIRDFHSVKISA